MDVKEQIRTIIVKKPMTKMDTDELGLFQSDCQYGTQVEKVTTTTKPGLGVGVNIPVTKHFGLGIRKTKIKTKTTSELIWEKTNCTILLTSKRLLYRIARKDYNMSFDSIQDIKVNKDAITIVSNGNPFYFFMKNSDVNRFLQTWALLGEAKKQGFNLSDIK